jgi:hypothetical protein
MADQKLRRMERDRFTSPVAMLDVMAYNISILAGKAGATFEEPQTAVVFQSSLGAIPAGFKVTISRVAYESTEDRAVAILKSGEEVSYKAEADGYVAIEGTLVPEGINQVIYLPWAVAPAVQP